MITVHAGGTLGGNGTIQDDAPAHRRGSDVVVGPATLNRATGDSTGATAYPGRVG